MTIDGVTFFDRSSDMAIDFQTNPDRCIEPVAFRKFTKDGKTYAALIPLPTHRVVYAFEHPSLADRLLRRPRVPMMRDEFNFEAAVKMLYEAKRS